MKLLGSMASPYVRRIRIQLEERPCDFVPINVFSEEGQAEILKYSPTMRVPILVDGETVVWDSLLICEYLSTKPLSLEEKKSLVLINEMTDSGIQLFQLRKFETDPQDMGVFSQNNLKRITQVLEYFEGQNLEKWGTVEEWLYCTLDWFVFRNVFPWQSTYPNLVSFMKSNKDRAILKSTAPE